MHSSQGPRAALVAVWLAAACITPACDDNNSNGDGGIEELGSTTCPGGVDKSVDIASAIPLTSGKEVQGFVCPLRDQDYFKVTNNDKSLLHLKIRQTVDVTPVSVTYLILDKDGKTVGTAPVWSGAGIRSFDDYHCLPAGTYYVMVKDDGDDGQDGQNPYWISFTSDTDVDTGEPNNDFATATAISAKLRLGSRNRSKLRSMRMRLT